MLPNQKFEDGIVSEQKNEHCSATILSSQGELQKDGKSIHGVCWCNCKGEDSVVHGWSAQGGPFK